MKNVLVITDAAPQDKNGYGTNSNMHCRIINSIRKLSVYTMYITNQPIKTTDHVIKVSNSSKIKKASAVIHGYPPYLNSRAIKSIFEVMQEKSISIVYIDNSISGRLIKKIKSRFSGISVVSFFHDIEIVKMKEDKDLSLGRRLILPVFYKNEQLTVDYADKIIVLNERDKKLFEKVYKKIPDAIVPITIPEIENIPFEKKHKKNDKLKILFVGVEYGPNLSGVRWFLNKVLPNVSCDYEFNVVGYHMENYRAEFEKYSDKVHTIGTVSSLKEWYVDADLVVAPIFEGGGMKVKTAEALSYGKHFIGCTESLEGYWEDMPDVIRDEKVFKCDTPQEFAKAIDRAAKSEYDINDIEIKDWADSCYSYEANLKKYESIFEHI
ncbi:glycosyltransferase [Coprococcus comes]|uniref:glycosyltransferase n=1 Tax=Coprococcus comes TaxID=410072 RepID=UPI00189C2524|nr:glycosyltransferase [Coprococcus comes]